MAGLSDRIKTYKRRYRKQVQEMIFMLQSELEHMDDEIFEPSSAIESGAFHLIQENNRLKSLLEVEG